MYPDADKLAQFSLNNVHKRGLKHHHFISDADKQNLLNGDRSFNFNELSQFILLSIHVILKCTMYLLVKYGDHLLSQDFLDWSVCQISGFIFMRFYLHMPNLLTSYNITCTCICFIYMLIWSTRAIFSLLVIYDFQNQNQDTNQLN